MAASFNDLTSLVPEEVGDALKVAHETRVREVLHTANLYLQRARIAERVIKPVPGVVTDDEWMNAIRHCETDADLKIIIAQIKAVGYAAGLDEGHRPIADGEVQRVRFGDHLQAEIVHHEGEG
jgi:hypothetical protein